jgi:hypothetical protein
MRSCLQAVSCVHYHQVMQCIIEQKNIVFIRADKGKYSVIL